MISLDLEKLSRQFNWIDYSVSCPNYSFSDHHPNTTFLKLLSKQVLDWYVMQKLLCTAMQFKQILMQLFTNNSEHKTLQ